MKRALLLAACLIAALLHADIIPNDREVVWDLNTVGVPGGIPTNQVVFTNLFPSQGSIGITNAMAFCPSNEVILLLATNADGAAAHFQISNVINFSSRHGIVLRGQGPGLTILSNRINTIPITSGVGGFWSGNPDILAGASKGSTNIHVNNSNALTDGGFILIWDGLGSHTNDSPSAVPTNAFVWARSGGSSGFMSHGARIMAHVGTTNITFWPPLPFELGHRSPKTTIGNFLKMSHRIGLEDLTLDMDTSTGAHGIQFNWNYACWLRNVEVRDVVSTGAIFVRSVLCEVKDCKFTWGSVGSDGYGISPFRESSGLLAWHNIFVNSFHSIIVENTGGSVFAYNFSTNLVAWPAGKVQAHYNSNHGLSPTYNLWEGNVGTGLMSDGYHSSEHAITIFRNRFHGLHPLYTDNRIMLTFNRFTYFANVVGNNLGAAWCQTDPNTIYQYTNGALSFPQTQAIYRFGFPSPGNNAYQEGIHVTFPGPPDSPSYPELDTNVIRYVLRHGNYDFFNEDVVWDDEIADQVIPSSLFLSSKPEAFGVLAWPPFGPTESSATNVIPAQYRYVYGDFPPSEPPPDPPYSPSFNIGTISATNLTVTGP